MQSKSNSLIPSTRGGVILCVTALVECALLLLCNALLFAQTYPTGSIAITLASVFMVFLAVRAQKTRNSVLLMSHVILNSLLFICAIIQSTQSGRGYPTVSLYTHYRFDATRGADKAFSVMQVAIIGLTQIALSYAASILFQDWKWSIISDRVVEEGKPAWRRSAVCELYKCMTWHIYHGIFYFVVLVLVDSRISIAAAVTIAVAVSYAGHLATHPYTLRSQKRWLLIILRITDTLFLLLAVAVIVLSNIALGMTVSRNNQTRILGYVWEAKISGIFWLNLFIPLLIAQFVLSVLLWHSLPKTLVAVSVSEEADGATLSQSEPAEAKVDALTEKVAEIETIPDCQIKTVADREPEKVV